MQSTRGRLRFKAACPTTPGRCHPLARCWRSRGLMNLVEDLSADQLSEAVVLWTGFHESPFPVRDEQRLVRRFGSEVAATLVPAILNLRADFFESDAALHEASLGEAGRKAADQFARLHPEISETAVQALAWCYTFDWR
jgi:hypothetical protein